MFGCSAHKLPGGVANILLSKSGSSAYDQVYDVSGLTVEELLRIWWGDWEFILKNCAFSKASCCCQRAYDACTCAWSFWVSKIL